VGGVVMALRGGPSSPATIEPPPQHLETPHPVIVAPVVTEKAPAPTEITLRVGSRPEGAEVVRPADGAILRVTPLELRMPSGHGTVGRRVGLPGYASERVELPADRDGQVQLVLTKETAEPRRRERRRDPAENPAASTPEPTGEPAKAPPPKKS